MTEDLRRSIERLDKVIVRSSQGGGPSTCKSGGIKGHSSSSFIAKVIDSKSQAATKSAFAPKAKASAAIE
jgi:hypothetical protein